MINDTITIDETWYVRPPNVPDRTSAGGVVVRTDAAGVVWVALVREEENTSLVLPKGGVENGENLETAARREIAEEAGFTHLEKLAFLGSTERLGLGKEVWITTHLFLFRTGQVDVLPTDVNAHPHPPVWVRLSETENADFYWPDQKQFVHTHRPAILRLLKEEFV